MAMDSFGIGDVQKNRTEAVGEYRDRMSYSLEVMISMNLFGSEALLRAADFIRCFR